MTVPTLTEFLLARIAEDEAVARAAAEHGPYQSGDWWGEGSWWLEGVEMLTVGKGDTGADVIAYTYVDEERAHIARHDPARVLARCKAKRQLVALHSDADDADAMCQSYAGNYTYEPCPTLRAVARTYADHPDYREEWRA